MLISYTNWSPAFSGTRMCFPTNTAFPLRNCSTKYPQPIHTKVEEDGSPFSSHKRPERYICRTRTIYCTMILTQVRILFKQINIYDDSVKYSLFTFLKNIIIIIKYAWKLFYWFKAYIFFLIKYSRIRYIDF